MKSQSKPVGPKQPCPCGTSSDGLQGYDDGHSYCYVCAKDFQIETVVKEVRDDNVTYQYLPWRGVSRLTMEKFKCATKVDSTGKPIEIGYYYDKNGAKVRKLEEKVFYSSGDMNGPKLFGREVFNSGSAKKVTITEGELDAMSVYEMMGPFPVVSVKGASSAFKDCSDPENFKFLNSFDEIILCLDNDAPGDKATKQIASLFDFNKVKVVPLTKYKDANEYLVQGEVKAFQNAWFNAKRLMRDDVVASFDDILKILQAKKDKPAVPFPFKTLQEMTYGIRTGECILFTAQEGIGKTEIIRAIEYHLLKETDANLGIIHLEEPKERSIEGFAGYELSTPVHLPNLGISPNEVFEAYKRAVKRDDRVHYYTHFGSDDPDDILAIIRFLVTACGCKYLFLDHITMVVTGKDDLDERKTLDYLSTRLKMLCQELDFALIFVSHVNDDNRTRGSRNISKIADLHIHLDRDKVHPDEDVRNTTNLVINKNRFASMTGPAGSLIFDKHTFKIEEKIAVLAPVMGEDR